MIVYWIVQSLLFLYMLYSLFQIFVWLPTKLKHSHLEIDRDYWKSMHEIEKKHSEELKLMIEKHLRFVDTLRASKPSDTEKN